MKNRRFTWPLRLLVAGTTFVVIMLVILIFVGSSRQGLIVGVIGGAVGSGVLTAALTSNRKRQ